MASTDPSLDQLIALARDDSAPAAQRHEAFAAVVRRFADLVMACAFARLRDHALAEDAAQDAFLVAWQRLDRLREPAAFPGWIQRLTMTQCHRRLRARRLDLLPADAALEVAGGADPGADAERAGDAARLRMALAQLAAADRLVLVLFYGAERSHAEIAEWLAVPVTTVARRLAHARRRLRLRHRALDGLAGSLRAPRDGWDAFELELAARMRAAEPADADAVARLEHGLGLETATAGGFPAPASAYLVEDPTSGTPIAYAAALPTIFRPIYRLRLAIGEEALKRHAGDVLLAQVVQDLAARDAIAVQVRLSARQAALAELLLARGFQVVERREDWRLAATAPATAPAPESTASDYEWTGVDALCGDPALFDSALELLTEAAADDPSSRPFLPIHPDTLRRHLRAQREGVVALAAGKVAGLIAAAADDRLPCGLRLSIVVVRERRRRQGLASAMLARLRATQGAAPLRLVTHPEAGVTAWLTGRGFTRVSDLLLLERLLRKTVVVAPELLAEYAGRYVVAARPDSAIVVERHGDVLISKARDMRDLLLAASDCEFFTRHHDGRGRFERDASGRVARLVFQDGPRELVAIRS